MAYRHYVLLLLLLVYVHCLLCRMLPAFLVSVPTPGCSGVCDRVATAPLCQRQSSWAPSESGSGAFCHCQDCRARLGAFAITRGAAPDGNWFNMRDGACIGHWQYGILMGYGFAVPFVLGSLVTARRVDVVDRRCSLALAVAVWSGSSAMMAGASSFGPVLLSRCLLGAAEALVVPASFSLIADYFEEHSQGFAGSVLSSGVCLGAGAASWAVPLALRVGWRTSCLGVGGAGAVLAALVAATVREPPRQHSEAHGRGSPAVGACVTWILTAASSLRLAASYTIAGFLPIYYLRADLPGYSASTYATANACLVACGGFLSAVIGGIATDHLSGSLASAPSLVAAVANLVATLLYVGVFTARTFAASCLFYGCALVVGECWYGLTLLQVKHTVPRGVQGQTLALVLSVATIASSAGPATAGALDPGDASLGLVLARIVALGTGLAAALLLLAAGLLELEERRWAAEPLTQWLAGEGEPGSPGRKRSALEGLTREVSLQLQRQVSISAPGHAEVVAPEGPTSPSGPPGLERRRSGSLCT